MFNMLDADDEAFAGCDATGPLDVVVVVAILSEAAPEEGCASSSSESLSIMGSALCAGFSSRPASTFSVLTSDSEEGVEEVC